MPFRWATACGGSAASAPCLGGWRVGRLLLRRGRGAPIAAHGSRLARCGSSWSQSPCRGTWRAAIGTCHHLGPAWREEPRMTLGAGILRTAVLYSADPWDSVLAVLRVRAPAAAAGVAVVQGNEGEAVEPEHA